MQAEEDDILARLCRGERIGHFDTVRLAKDGQRVHLSLTISPVLDGSGNVIGASKIARDITERKRSEELQHLLFNELNHRVKNTLAMIQAIASQSLRTASKPAQFVDSFNGRVNALARAHDLLVQHEMKGAGIHDLVRDQVSLGAANERRVTYSGPGLLLESRTAVHLALVLHELATNARKYGALSIPEGALSITWKVDVRHGRVLHLHWRESGVANLQAPRKRGFGTTLIDRSLEANRGEVHLDFGADGIVCDIELPLPEEERYSFTEAAIGANNENLVRKGAGSARHGKRILIVEDEPLIAMELESTLASHGFEVVGPASHVESAIRLIGQERLDAALLDANLGGKPVTDVAEALAEKGVPFAFGTGFGREAPAGRVPPR
ncbi:HWE histidine kinase domain-containing protein [Roseibium salinum]|nr:HWE histidine kinase domain-containing protein [Roseibium salinum]